MPKINFGEYSHHIDKEDKRKIYNGSRRAASAAEKSMKDLSSDPHYYRKAAVGFLSDAGRLRKNATKSED